MPYRYPPEFHRKVLGLITVGRSAASIAADLGVSSQTVAVRRKPELIDTGSTQGLTTDEAAELVGVGLEHRDDSPRCRCAHAVGFRNGTGNRGRAHVFEHRHRRGQCPVAPSPEIRRGPILRAEYRRLNDRCRSQAPCGVGGRRDLGQEEAGDRKTGRQGEPG